MPFEYPPLAWGPGGKPAPSCWECMTNCTPPEDGEQVVHGCGRTSRNWCRHLNPHLRLALAGSFQRRPKVDRKLRREIERRAQKPAELWRRATHRVGLWSQRVLPLPLATEGEEADSVEVRRLIAEAWS